MVSEEDLIYHFVDIYLGCAMECSICRESLTMKDDKAFLDDFMKTFVSLFQAVRQDKSLSLDMIMQTLTQRKERTLSDFYVFLKTTVLEDALKKELKKAAVGKSSFDVDSCFNKAQQVFNNIFDEGTEVWKDHPTDLLKHVRERQEAL